ncbi:OmpA family protein [Flavitalea antarctica]
MKQTCTLLLIILALSNNSWSQVRVSLLGGPQSSSVKETNDIPDWEKDKKPFYQNRSGFHLGFMLSAPLNNSQTVFFQPAFLYTTKGNKYYKQNDTTSYKPVDSVFYSNNFFTSYIEVPLNLAYRLKLGKKAGLMVSAGPYVSFFFNGKETSATRTFRRDMGANPDYELEETVKNINQETIIEVGKGENKIKTLDLGYNLRAGFDIGNVMLTGFYSEGLTSFYQSAYTADFKNRVIGASLSVWLNKIPPPVPRDLDADGVPDKSDKCPEIAGLQKYLGCPATDTDNDGVPDESDPCPAVPGLVKYSGCPVPDGDNDGVNDELDKCPALGGTLKYEGCPIPDTDGDGINDEIDQCPAEKGVPKYNGCPVPDKDGDGVNDEEDECPESAGVASNRGCPEIRQEVIEKVNYAARNIFFNTGSDQIQRKSYPGLDEVASIMQKSPGLKLQIDGHSDNTGQASRNLRLSQQRAEAVKKYLVSKGIAADRLGATGYGDQKPLAENSTKLGQSTNRRVEMKLKQD